MATCSRAAARGDQASTRPVVATAATSHEATTSPKVQRRTERSGSGAVPNELMAAIRGAIRSMPSRAVMAIGASAAAAEWR